MSKNQGPGVQCEAGYLWHDSNQLGLALGFVSGVLIYISASHLLPEAGAHEKEHSVLSFFAGVALALLLLLIE